MSKMGMQNKAESYAAFKPGSVKDRIIEAMRGTGGLDKVYQSRRDLCESTGIEIATLCGALATLKRDGYVREAFSSTCPQTGKLVIMYTLVTGAFE